MSLTNEDFDAAINRFHQKWGKFGQATRWKDVKLLRQYGIALLRIERKLQISETSFLPVSISATDDNTEHVEDDPEALQPRISAAQDACAVIYDIIHSTSYQVPVLYFSVKQQLSARPLSLEQIHELLVPAAYQHQVEAVGVMGALSMIDHPVSSVPVYFVHPCRTQEAMRALLINKETLPLEYLMMWLGLAGGSVGLHVPIELVQAMELERGQNQI